MLREIKPLERHLPTANFRERRRGFFTHLAALPSRPAPRAQQTDGSADPAQRLTDFLAAALPPRFLDDFQPSVMGSLSLFGSVANTLQDTVRTRKFCQAVMQAARCFRNLNDVEIVDAGCGPLAVLSLAAAYACPRARITALELSPAAVFAAEKTVQHFGLKNIRIVEADAITYRHPRPIDLLISETIGTGLLSEPVAQVLGNLAPQVHPERGLIIPEHLSLECAFVSRTAMDALPFYRYGSDCHQPVKSDFQEVARYVSLNPDARAEEIAFSVSVPPRLRHSREPYGLYMRVQIGLIPKLMLEANESLLTLATPIVPPQLLRGIEQIDVAFTMGDLDPRVKLIRGTQP